MMDMCVVCSLVRLKFDGLGGSRAWSAETVSEWPVRRDVWLARGCQAQSSWRIIRIE